jgi:hypothetical protein
MIKVKAWIYTVTRESRYILTLRNVSGTKKNPPETASGG